MTERPERLLTQNSELRKAGVWNWTLPAHVVTLTNGSRFNCCPNAGSCGRVCYAKFGTYNFSNVKRRHIANLEYVLEDPIGWKNQMLREVQHKRFQPSGKPHTFDHDPTDLLLSNWITHGGKAVRIHDGGDFFNDDYFLAWCEIARLTPWVLFYAYTKEVSLTMRLEPQTPPNVRLLYSYGGKEDHLIDPNSHRHADVFPTLDALTEAGYYDQSDNDLIAITAPTTRIGIVANNLPVAVRRFDGKAMSDLAPMRNSTEEIE